MATQNEEVTSREDKFFGIQSTIGDPNDVEEIEVEVEEEEEGEGKKNIPARADKSTAADDDDLGDYSDRVRRRINKLTKDKHDERRAREEAENLRDEAVRVATVLQQRNQQSEHIIATGEGELVRRIHQGAEAALNAAETEHRVAYESGDTDAVIASQKKMLKAQAELLQATQYAEDYQRRQWQPGEPFAGQMPPQMPPQQMPPQPPPQQRPAEPTPEAQSWAKKNEDWFNNPKHRDMTAVAYATHETMVRDEDYLPDTDEYYKELDKRIRARFPEHFAQQQASPPEQSTSPVVAPASREGGGKPRKVKLTPSQLRLANKFGLTPEQYANQLIKDLSND